MFKGTNELKICGATLEDAIEYWLENVVFNKAQLQPRVASCKPTPNESGITILLEAPDETDS